MKVKDIIFAEYNPRKLTKDQKKNLQDSLTRFGFVDPVIVNRHPDRHNILVGGHQRIKVWSEMGHDTVPAVFVELDPNKEKELNIRLNKNTGEWDFEALQSYFDMGDLQEWGFNEDEFLKDVFQEEPEEPEETQGDDDMPEKPEPRTVRGDLYILGGKHRVMCGDSTILTDVEKLMDGQKADMVFTDPPYGIKRAGGFGGAGGFSKPIKRRVYNNDSWDNQRPKQSTFDLILSHTKKAIIWGGNFFADILPTGKHWLVWDKHNSMPTFGDCELAWTNLDRASVKKYEFTYNGLIGKEKERFHPTQKPIGLFVEIFNDYSFDLCADFFLGSGSTLIAAEKTDRKCYGMELDEHYCDIIVNRYVGFCIKNNREWSVNLNGQDITQEYNHG